MKTEKCETKFNVCCDERRIFLEVFKREQELKKPNTLFPGI
jgi:dTDP-4-dehydrorhamnose 3,5-epimerase-like enzyme